MIELREISRRYVRASREVTALDRVSLRVERGEFVVVRGPSGSGKTTLLLTAGAMLRPTGGSVLFDGSDLYAMSAAERAALRASRIGYIFQLFNLVPYLSAVENVLLGPRGPRAGRPRALALLDRLGLADRATHRPSELSVGERQRVAVARALLESPEVVLADEPVAGLDDESAALVIESLREAHAEGSTLLLATHGRVAEFGAAREFTLRVGRLVESGASAPETHREVAS